MKTIGPILCCAALSVALADEPESFEALAFHAAPKPLAEAAVTADWPRFLGPNNDATTPEKPLLEEWPDEGLPRVWEMETGEGYASPVVADGRLVYFHKVGGEERVECLDPETGKRFWSFAYPVEYKDRYGFSEGPRGSAVIGGGRVHVAGVTAMLHTLDLESGKLLWRRDLTKEFGVPQYFFGYGPSPELSDGKLVVNVGGKPDEGKAGVCVAAFDAASGKLEWTHEDEWGASYASPVVAELKGRKVALVMGGGESKPSIGGLLVLDAGSGERLARIPWRSGKYESVIAMSPMVVGEDSVFISECYEKGGALVRFGDDWEPESVWENREFGMHWMMPIEKDGFLYGFAGRNPPDSAFKCAELETGEIQWEDPLRWQNEQGQVEGMFRASLLVAGDRYFALGEDGIFAELELSQEKPEVLRRTRLFSAREAWALPVLSRGLMYVSQNSVDAVSGSKPRLICYDLRGD